MDRLTGSQGFSDPKAIAYLRDVYSVGNLTPQAKRAGVCGQVSTILLLAIGVLLSFLLMTANLGQVSATSTNLQNVADSTTLLLGSRLVTKAEQLYNANERKISNRHPMAIWKLVVAVLVAIIAIVLYCTGWLAWLGALLTVFLTSFAAGAAVLTVVAYVATFLTWISSIIGMTATVGMVGGLIGGMIGGALDTGSVTGALLGGLQGAGIGMAIGGGVDIVASAFASAPETATFTAGEGGINIAGGGANGGTVVVDANVAAQATQAAPMSQQVVTQLAPGQSLWVPQGVSGTVTSGSIDLTGLATITGQAGMVHVATSSAEVATQASQATPALSASQQFTTTLPKGASMLIPADSSATVSGALSIPSTIGAISGGALSTGSALTSGYVNMQMKADAIARFFKRLQILSEKDSIRESILLQAFTDTVDDPNKTADSTAHQGGCSFPDETLNAKAVGDPNDSDGDGNKTESIPCFQYWWDQRVERLANATNDDGMLIFQARSDALDQFLNATLPQLRQFTQEEGEALASSRETRASDSGELVQWLRALHDKGRLPDGFFWQPGPSAEGYRKLFPPEEDLKGLDKDALLRKESVPGYDQVDMTADQFRVMREAEIDSLTAYEASDPLARFALLYNWEFWVPAWYNQFPPDPEDAEDGGESAGSVYEELGQMADRFKAWDRALADVKRALPPCAIDSDGKAQNAPCNNQDQTIAGQDPSFATIDADVQTDEFAAMHERLAGSDPSSLASRAESFQRQLLAFYNDMTQAGALDATPATYAWKDSRGLHRLTVEVSDFILPWIKQRFVWDLPPYVRVRVKNYSDDGTNTWVKITREDEERGIGKTPGALWTWNASVGSGDASQRSGPKMSKITKTAHARYNILTRDKILELVK